MREKFSIALFIIMAFVACRRDAEIAALGEDAI